MAKITSFLFSTLKSCRHIPFRPLPQNQYHFSLFSSQTIPRNRNTKVNFSPSDSESDDDNVKATDKIKPPPPPPYDPFNKTQVITEPDDPTNLQQVFHNIRTEGLQNSAVKMFDALSKDGLTHEALDLFSQIKDKGHMPDVVAHTAVIEAYAAAGKAKEALKVYMRMLASGVLPNAYTYTVLIKVLAGSGEPKMMGEARKFFVEMMEKGIRPNAGTCVAVFESLVKDGKEDEGRELVVKMKDFGFVPDEEGLRDVMKDKRGQVFRSVMEILLGK